MNAKQRNEIRYQDLNAQIEWKLLVAVVMIMSVVVVMVVVVAMAMSILRSHCYTDEARRRVREEEDRKMRRRLTTADQNSNGF